MEGNQDQEQANVKKKLIILNYLNGGGDVACRLLYEYHVKYKVR